MSDKKSEKLEIRLSYDEKQELVEAAETEGRTVSDLVRGLIKRYIKTTSARLPDTRLWKRLWPSMIGLAVAAFMAGHIATWAYTRAHNHGENIYSLNMSTLNGSLTTPVLARDGYATDITLAGSDGDLMISLQVEDNSDVLAILRVNICRQIGANCEPIASPILHFNPNSSAAITINNDEQDEVSIILFPPRPKKTKK